MFPPNKMEICSQQTKVLEAHGLIKFQLNSYMSMFQKTLIVTRVGGGDFPVTVRNMKCTFPTEVENGM